MTVTDSHVYCLPPRLRDPHVRLPRTEAAVLKAIHRHPDGAWVLPLSSPEKILASMHEGRIDRSILIAFPWASAKLCAENNDYILEQTARRPDQFLAVCSVQPKSKGALKEAERCLNAGAVGLKLNPEWQGYRLDAPAVDAVARLAARRGRYLLVHVDQPFRASRASPAALLALARRNPKTRIVAAHMGGLLGLYSCLPSVAASLRNVWFDTAVSETLQMVSWYVDAGLGDRVLFGSDFPFNACHSQKLVHDRLLALGLTKAERTRILSGNLAALLRKPR